MFKGRYGIFAAGSTAFLGGILAFVAFSTTNPFFENTNTGLALNHSATQSTYRGDGNNTKIVRVLKGGGFHTVSGLKIDGIPLTILDQNISRITYTGIPIRNDLNETTIYPYVVIRNGIEENLTITHTYNCELGCPLVDCLVN